MGCLLWICPYCYLWWKKPQHLLPLPGDICWNYIVWNSVNAVPHCGITSSATGLVISGTHCLNPFCLRLHITVSRTDSTNIVSHWSFHPLWTFASKISQQAYGLHMIEDDDNEYLMIMTNSPSTSELGRLFQMLTIRSLWSLPWV